MGWLWYHFHDYGDCKIEETQMHKINEQKGWVVLCPHQLHEVFEIWFFLTLNWNHSPHLARKHFNYNEGPRCTWCYGLLLHIHLWLLFQIDVKGNVLQRHRKIKSIKCDLWDIQCIPHGNETNSIKGLVMAKGQATQRTCAFQHGMWPCAIWKYNWNNCENPFAESFGWK